MTAAPLVAACLSIGSLACGSRTELLVEPTAAPSGHDAGLDGGPIIRRDSGPRIDAGAPIDGGARVDGGPLPLTPCELVPVGDITAFDLGELNSGYATVTPVRDGFLAAWAHSRVDYKSGLDELLVRRFDLDGRPLGDATDAGPGHFSLGLWLQETAHGPLLTWFDQPVGMPAGTCFRWLDETGAPFGDARCPDELRGGGPVMFVSPDEVLITSVAFGPRTVYRLAIDGSLSPVDTVPEHPHGIGRIGDELVWLRWTMVARRRGDVELYARDARVVLTDVPESQATLRSSGDGVRILWPAGGLTVLDVTSDSIREVLHLVPTGMVSHHPVLTDDQLAFTTSDASAMTVVQVEQFGRGTSALGSLAPGPGGCHPGGVALASDRVAVAWVGALEGSANCTPHFAVLACTDFSEP